MSKIIYLHIGLHKTGTTTIQESIRENVDLLAQHGIFYPRTGHRFNNFAQFNVAFQITDDALYDPQQGTLADLADEVNQSPMQKVLISVENFSLASVASIRQLHQALAPLGKVIVIVYLRRQDLWLNSWWAYAIFRDFVQNDFPDFVEKVLAGSLSATEHPRGKVVTASVNPDFAGRLEPWEAFFGKENLRLRVMEKSQLRGHLFEDFLSILGIEDTSSFTPAPNQNVSPGPKTLAAFRLISDKFVRPAYRKHIMIRLIKDYALAHDWNAAKFNGIDQEMHDTIMSRFAAGNTRLAQTYFGRDNLFTEPFVPGTLTGYGLEALTPAELLDLSIYLMGNIHLAKVNADPPQTNEKELKQLRERNAQLERELQTITQTRGWKALVALRRVFGPLYRSIIKR